jgi:hypothetical protein
MVQEVQAGLPGRPLRRRAREFYVRPPTCALAAILIERAQSTKAHARPEWPATRASCRYSKDIPADAAPPITAASAASEAAPLSRTKSVGTLTRGLDRSAGSPPPSRRAWPQLCAQPSRRAVAGVGQMKPGVGSKLKAPEGLGAAIGGAGQVVGWCLPACSVPSSGRPSIGARYCHTLRALAAARPRAKTGEVQKLAAPPVRPRPTEHAHTADRAASILHTAHDFPPGRCRANHRAWER